MQSKKIWIKLATTYSKNERQQNDQKQCWITDHMDEDDLTWKMLEETIRRGRNRTTKAYLVMDDETIYVNHRDLLIAITISSMFMSTAYSPSQPFTTVQSCIILSFVRFMLNNPKQCYFKCVCVCVGVCV